MSHVTPKQARDLIADRLRTVPGIATAWSYEPENLGALPATTMMLQGIVPNERATGLRLDVQWTFQLRLYVNLSDWQKSQEQLETILDAVLVLWRDDPTLGNEVEWWRITDSGVIPEFSPEQHWLRKTLNVLVMVEHVGE